MADLDAADAHPEGPPAGPPALVFGAIAMVALGAILLIVAFVGGRSSEQVESTTTTTPPPLAPGMAPGTTAPLAEGLGESWGTEELGRTPLSGFGEVQATITAPDGETCQVCLLAASDPEQRARGLMEITDVELGGYQGMFFEYPAETSGAFWMRDTPLALTIAYADRTGTVHTVVDMEPCDAEDDCPSYPADRPFRFAVEVPQGTAPELGLEDGSTIRITGRSCPLREYGPDA